MVLEILKGVLCCVCIESPHIFLKENKKTITKYTYIELKYIIGCTSIEFKGTNPHPGLGRVVSQATSKFLFFAARTSIVKSF